MPAKPIQLGALQFTRRGDAATYLRNMLNRYDVGDKVTSSDSATLLAAIALHRDATALTGSGIGSFSVRSAEYGTKSFWLNRTDGSTETLSIRSCIYT